MIKWIIIGIAIAAFLVVVFITLMLYTIMKNITE